MKTITILAAAAVAALLAASPAGARAFPAGDESSTNGTVTATLSWDDGPRNAFLTITRDGATPFNQAIPDVVCDGCLLPGDGADDVRVADLDDDGEPEVLVASVSGEDCCVLSGIYDYQPDTGTYREYPLDWRSAGFNFDDVDADGVPEFVSGDLRFDVRFQPPVVWHYDRSSGQPDLVNVTRDFPSVIRRHAGEMKRNLRRGEGYLIAYVADQYLLGNGRAGLRELDRQIARGDLGRLRRGKILRRLSRYGYR